MASRPVEDSLGQWYKHSRLITYEVTIRVSGNGIRGESKRFWIGISGYDDHSARRRKGQFSMRLFQDRGCRLAKAMRPLFTMPVQQLSEYVRVPVRAERYCNRHGSTLNSRSRLWSANSNEKTPAEDRDEVSSETVKLAINGVGEMSDRGTD